MSREHPHRRFGWVTAPPPPARARPSATNVSATCAALHRHPPEPGRQPRTCGRPRRRCADACAGYAAIVEDAGREAVAVRAGSTPAPGAASVAEPDLAASPSTASHSAARTRSARAPVRRLATTTPSIMSASTAFRGRPRNRTDTSGDPARRRIDRSRSARRGGLAKSGTTRSLSRAARPSERAVDAKSSELMPDGAATVTARRSREAVSKVLPGRIPIDRYRRAGV